MSADELRVAYQVRATEVRVLTQKLKHKAAQSRVLFSKNINAKLDSMGKSVRPNPLLLITDQSSFFYQASTNI